MEAPRDRGIGVRIREVRTWRRQSLRAVAELAGISEAYLSMIERGRRSADGRQLVEAIADALQVAPSELLGEPSPLVDPVSREAHAGIEDIGIALAHNRLGQPYLEQPRSWPEVQADLRRFLGQLVPDCDYQAQAVLLPGLLEDLYATHAADPQHRQNSLVGLMYALQHAAALLKNLGAHGMPLLASMHMRYVADELGDPAWAGVAEWRVGQSSGGDRRRMLTVSRRAAEALDGDPDPRSRQVVGMLHLNAALASASVGRADDARTHLGEARDLVEATNGHDFADMHFGLPNWSVWRVAVGVELGEGPAVAEVAQQVQAPELPAAERRGMFYGDWARGMAQDKTTRDHAVVLLRQAEQAAPQRVRTNPYLRDTVADLMRRTRGHAARDVRGIAYRMGLAVA